jgi:hypothetical protein
MGIIKQLRQGPELDLLTVLVPCFGINKNTIDFTLDADPMMLSNFTVNTFSLEDGIGSP